MSNFTLGTGAKLHALGARPASHRRPLQQLERRPHRRGDRRHALGDATSASRSPGINGTSGALNATPKAAAFGTGNNVKALVLVPNGTLATDTNLTGTGAFLGRDVDISTGSTLTFQDGFSGCSAAACNDNNVCTVDTCNADGTCGHAPLPTAPPAATATPARRPTAARPAPVRAATPSCARPRTSATRPGCATRAAGPARTR